MPSERTQQIEFRYKPSWHARLVLWLSIIGLGGGLLGGLVDFSDYGVFVEIGLAILYDRWWSHQRVRVDEKEIRLEGIGLSRHGQLAWYEIHRVHQRGWLTIKFLVFDGGQSGVLAVFSHLKNFEQFVKQVDEYLPAHVVRSGSFFRKYADKRKPNTNGFA